MPSFDIVCKVDWSEVTNALDQARREVGQRFDFKGTHAELERVANTIVIHADAEDRVNAALEVLKEKIIRRKVSLKHLDVGEPQKGPRGTMHRVVTIREGIDVERARTLVKRIKALGKKAQAAIQEDLVRVSAKKRDDLQDIIHTLRAAEDLDLPLDFINFRE